MVVVQQEMIVEDQEAVHRHDPTSSRVLEGTWSKKEPTAVALTYTLTPGPSSQIGRDVTACQLFCCFFVDAMWELLVVETNRYAASNTSAAPHARPGHDVTVPEMKAFVGMLILMDIDVLPRLEMSG